MRASFTIFCSFFAFTLLSQNPVNYMSDSNKWFTNIDSVIFYQCHVEEAVQQLTTASGQTLTGAPAKYSVTEKFVIQRDSSVYRIKYFVSSLTILPNKKFSGLKIREKDYWNFKLVKDTILTEKAVKRLSAIENKGREATEYDFAVSKYTTNQIIIKNKKRFRQLIIDGNYILSKLLFI